MELIPKVKSGIHIKKENKGKFTKYCNGKVTSECIARGKKSNDPAVRKRAIFAANARKWKHLNGGVIFKFGLGGIAEAAGFIPGPIGNVANAILLVKDVATGNFLGAGLDLLGIIPGLGPMGKAAAKSSKLVNKIKTISATTDKVSDVIKADKSLLKAAKEYELVAKEYTEQELGKETIKKVAKDFFDGDFNVAKDRLTIASLKAYENKILQQFSRKDVDDFIKHDIELDEYKPLLNEILEFLDTRKSVQKIDYKKATVFNPKSNVLPMISENIQADHKLKNMDMVRSSGNAESKLGIKQSEYQQGLTDNVVMLNGKPTRITLSKERQSNKFDVNNNATVSKVIYSSDVEDYKNNILIPLAEAQGATKEQIAFLKNFKSGVGAVESGSIANTTFHEGFARISKQLYDKLGSDRIKAILVHENIGHGLENSFLHTDYLKAFKDLGIKDVGDVRAVINELRFTFFQSLKNQLGRSPNLKELNKFIESSPDKFIHETLEEISHRKQVGTAVDIASKMSNLSFVSSFKLKLMTLLGLASPIIITGTTFMKNGNKLIHKLYGHNLDNVVGNGWTAEKTYKKAKKKLIKKHSLGGTSSLSDLMVGFESVLNTNTDHQVHDLNRFQSSFRDLTRPVLSSKPVETADKKSEDNSDLGFTVNEGNSGRSGSFSINSGNSGKQLTSKDYSKYDIEDLMRELGFLKINGKDVHYGDRNIRDPNSKIGAKNSHHKEKDSVTGFANARDISIVGGTLKDYEDLKQKILNTPQLVKYLQNKKWGIINEVTNQHLSRTKGTGLHFHFGPDQWANRIFNYWVLNPNTKVDYYIS